MNVLCNLSTLPSSESIRFIPFGRGESFEEQYDYSRPFPDFLKEALKKRPVDAVFIYYPEFNFIPPGLEEADIPVFGLVSDWNLGFYALEGNAGRFDWIITDKGGVEAFNRVGVTNVFHWNMYGWNPGRMVKVPGSKEEWDILFIGNMNAFVQGERNRFVKRLLDMSDRFRVRVETNLRGPAYAKALQSAKIVFNRSVRGEANMRVFEALALDKLVFIEESNLEIREFLEPETECVLYNDGNLEEKLEYYVKNDAAREAIVSKAARKKEQYSYPAMLEKLFRQISQVKTGIPRKFLELPEEERLYYAARQGFYSTGIPSDSAVVLDGLNRLSGSSKSGRHLGLMLMLHRVRAAARKTTADDEKSAQALYRFLKKAPEGRIFNLLNYALFLKSLNRFDAEIAVLSELLVQLSREPVAPAAFEGAPCLGFTSQFAQEFSLAGFTRTGEKAHSIRAVMTEMVLLNLAEACLACDAQDRATALLTDALTLNPDNGTARYLLGRALLPSNPVRALEEFRRAYGISPFYPGIWSELLSLEKSDGKARLLQETKRAEHLSKRIYGDQVLR